MQRNKLNGIEPAASVLPMRLLTSRHLWTKVWSITHIHTDTWQFLTNQLRDGDNINIIVCDNKFNLPYHCRQLLHKFLVEKYIEIENERLIYVYTIKLKKNLRAENYIRLEIAVRKDSSPSPIDLCQIVILSSTFVNTLRYYWIRTNRC